ncbi:hypothetical protein PI125_g9822 [Phytophthora idaei]|nr:hypothetical protein PI125_g9822 [Phytophthora idaei]
MCVEGHKARTTESEIDRVEADTGDERERVKVGDGRVIGRLHVYERAGQCVGPGRRCDVWQESPGCGDPALKLREGLALVPRKACKNAKDGTGS